MPRPGPAPRSAARGRAAAGAPLPPTPVKAIRVTLETIRPVWLRIIVDGARAFEGELPAGEKLAVEGDRAVVVRAGDAGGVRATLNGADRGPLGRDGWPLTVSITPDGIPPLTPTRPEPRAAPSDEPRRRPAPTIPAACVRPAARAKARSLVCTSRMLCGPMRSMCFCAGDSSSSSGSAYWNVTDVAFSITSPSCTGTSTSWPSARASRSSNGRLT